MLLTDYRNRPNKCNKCKKDKDFSPLFSIYHVDESFAFFFISSFTGLAQTFAPLNTLLKRDQIFQQYKHCALLHVNTHNTMLCCTKTKEDRYIKCYLLNPINIWIKCRFNNNNCHCYHIESYCFVLGPNNPNGMPASNRQSSK